MRQGNGAFWAVQFSTGGFSGHRHETRKAAQQEAEDTNRYTNRTSGESVVVAVVRFRQWERCEEYTV